MHLQPDRCIRSPAQSHNHCPQRAGMDVPVVLGLVNRFGKLFPPGFGEQEAETSAGDGKAAENNGGYGRVVRGQHVDQWGHQTTGSARDGAQTGGSLPGTNHTLPFSQSERIGLSPEVETHRKDVGNSSCTYTEHTDPAQLRKIRPAVTNKVTATTWSWRERKRIINKWRENPSAEGHRRSGSTQGCCC